MPDAKMLRYSETLDYEYITCFSTFGAFTNKTILHDSLPTGFYVYYMTMTINGEVDKLTPADRTDFSLDVFGTFISKKEIPGKASAKGTRINFSEDVDILIDPAFDFEEFFGTHPTIDSKIEYAYRIQAVQIKQAKLKKRNRGSKNQTYTQNRDR